jgi:hypothetical protein
MGLRCGVGFSGNHTVYLFDISSTLLRSVTINMTGAVAGRFYYGDITPITLTNSTYYLMTDITANDGQDWSDSGSTTLTNVGAATTFSAYSVTPPYTTFVDFTMNQQYFGVDLK